MPSRGASGRFVKAEILLGCELKFRAFGVLMRHG
jgi:hypothetical protein